MSDSIPIQWISKYLVDVAERYGKSFTEIPIDVITPTKKKRVQIVEFLTYNEGAAIWGRVSDKESVIPVCFTKAAVSQYMKELQGRRLTEAKNAIFYIGQLRPTFVPIPVGNNRPKLTDESHIALEAGVVKYIGSGLGVCGSPQDVELNTKVRAWVRGLRRGGDGGDILKCRKQETRDTANSPPPIHETCPVTNHLEAPPKPQVRQPERDLPHIVSETPVRSPDPMRQYRKRWIHLEKNRLAYMKPYVDEVQDEPPQLGQLPVQDNMTPNAMIVVPRSQPCTPPRTRTPEQNTNEQTTPRISEWSPSVRGSPAGVLPCIPPNDHAAAGPSADGNLDFHEPFTPPATSPLRPPTPAQRFRRPSPSEPRIPSPSSPSNSPFVSGPLSSFPVHIRRNIERRVPYPGLPPSPTDRSGPTQILVPNSDTSGTQSQSRSQPRSQPLSQSRSHQPAFPSQLTQEFKPGQTSTPAVVKQGRRVSEILPGDQPESHLNGDWVSSAGFTGLGVCEELGHDNHQLSGTSPDVQQALEASVTEKVPETDVDAVDGAGVATVLQRVPSQIPEEPSHESERMEAAPSPPPSHSPLHSLFSDSPTSMSQRIPHIISRAASPHPAESIASTSRVLLHDAEAWKRPSFMNAQDRGKAVELNEKPYETHKRKRLSPRLSSPLASQKRRRILEDNIMESHPAQPTNENEGSTSSVSNNGGHTKKSIVGDSVKESSSIEQLSLPEVSKDVNQSQDASSRPWQPGHKKRKTRLQGYQVDFDHMPIDAQGSNPRMNMRHIRTILLRTGRIRTLGDEVVRDGSIYTKSD